jgi:hypothetical protein
MGGTTTLPEITSATGSKIDGSDHVNSPERLGSTIAPVEVGEVLVNTAYRGLLP